MKRIIAFTLATIGLIVLFTSCTKRDRYYYDDWDYYKNEESGRVTYVSEVGSPYSVIKMFSDGQYAVVYSKDNDDSKWPYTDDIIYGDFTTGGERKVYNKTAGYTIRLEVDDFFRNENDAINSVIRKEDQEGYVASYKKSPIKIQRATRDLPLKMNK